MASKIEVPGFKAEVSDRLERLACYWCLAVSAEGVLRPPGSDGRGLCRRCCSMAAAAWSARDEQVRSEVDDGRPRMSVVLASRRRWSFEKTGVLLPAELSSSYEFMVVDGRLPATNVADTDVFGGRGDEAALDALSRCGYVAWKSRLVRLYDGRDAEGVMLSVFAPRLLGRRHDAPGERYLDVRWVRWPLSEALGHDPGLGRVLDRAFEELLVERLSEGAPEPCQLLSEAAVRFVELSLSSRDDPAADASMLPVYRRAMSESEIMAADVLVATRDQELGVDETVADKEEDAAGESAGGEIEDEPGEDVDDRGEPEEGFAR